MDRISQIIEGGCQTIPVGRNMVPIGPPVYEAAIVCGSPFFRATDPNTGREWTFEFHRYHGPIPVRKDTLDPFKRNPGPAFWRFWDAIKEEFYRRWPEYGRSAA